jgi:hypothetical protein
MNRPTTIAARQQQVANRPPEPPTALERPAYAADFAEWLAYRFTQVAPPQVPTVLDSHFPTPDQLDCAYLEAVLREIADARHCEREVGCGAEFVFGGIEFSAPHLAAARQWAHSIQAHAGSGSEEKAAFPPELGRVGRR